MLPASADEAVANKKGTLDPKAGVVDAGTIVAAEGGVAAANDVLAAEREVFGRAPYRRPLEEKTQAEDGYYLFGWTIPEIAFRIALPDKSRHLPHVVMSTPQRVGGVMRRLGVLGLASAQHTLAIVEGGKLYSWGVDWDARGQPAGLLGRKGPYWRPALVDVFSATPGAAPEPIVAVAAGRTHSVAVTQSGKVFTWGLNSHGQLGRATGSKVLERPLLFLDAPHCKGCWAFWLVLPLAWRHAWSLIAHSFSRRACLTRSLGLAGGVAGWRGHRRLDLCLGK